MKFSTMDQRTSLSTKSIRSPTWNLHLVPQSCRHYKIVNIHAKEQPSIGIHGYLANVIPSLVRCPSSTWLIQLLHDLHMNVHRFWFQSIPHLLESTSVQHLNNKSYTEQVIKIIGDTWQWGMHAYHGLTVIHHLHATYMNLVYKIAYSISWRH